MVFCLAVWFGVNLFVTIFLCSIFVSRSFVAALPFQRLQCNKIPDTWYHGRSALWWRRWTFQRNLSTLFWFQMKFALGDDTQWSANSLKKANIFIDAHGSIPVFLSNGFEGTKCEVVLAEEELTSFHHLYKAVPFLRLLLKWSTYSIAGEHCCYTVTTSNSSFPSYGKIGRRRTRGRRTSSLETQERASLN